MTIFFEAILYWVELTPITENNFFFLKILLGTRKCKSPMWFTLNFYWIVVLEGVEIQGFLIVSKSESKLWKDQYSFPTIFV
jgi:hypothetical protein